VLDGRVTPVGLQRPRVVAPIGKRVPTSVV